VTEAPTLPRRIAFLALALAIMAGLFWLAGAVLAPGGWTVAEILILICIAGTLPWAALSAGNALIGLGLLLFTRDPVAAVLPALAAARPGIPRGRTAIAICIRREDMALVLPPLARLLSGLAEAGAAERFSLWFLSDTPEGADALAEEAACRAFAAAQPIATHYRRRAQNTGFKSGNVMEFLDHHADGHEFMLCLDADSEMTATAVLRLVACMEADPKLAILQQLIHGRPTKAGFPRLFQFGMRHGMRAWATGQAWWQGDEGPYWGHNAVIRIAPFRTHARLETLPDGSHILSHDQVEATRLHAAGWKVRVLPDDAGSSEGNPPSYSDFITRAHRRLVLPLCRKACRLCRGSAEARSCRTLWWACAIPARRFDGNGLHRLHGTRAVDEPMPVSARDALWHAYGLGAAKSQRTRHWVCGCAQAILGADACRLGADLRFCGGILHRAAHCRTRPDQPAWRYSLCHADRRCAVFCLAGQAAHLRAARGITRQLMRRENRAGCPAQEMLGGGTGE